MEIPEVTVPITPISLERNIQLFIKREDLIHPEISGNKYWKLFFNIKNYLNHLPKNPRIITFGGAFSNHIAAISALGKEFNIPTLGIIRGEELQNSWLQNPTLELAYQNGMRFKFVTRENYRDKDQLAQNFKSHYPNAIIIPEGGSNHLAVEGVKMMLNSDTKDFDYLCIAVGTGGSVAGISQFCEEDQKVVGFKVVKDASLETKISELTSKQNFNLIDASFGGYGKFNDELIAFINDFKMKYGVPLEPIYTGKMMMKVFELIHDGYFPDGAKILCFHTGGLQGIKGANQFLEKHNRDLIL